MLVKVRQFLTKKEDNPVPFRTMQIIETKRETQKAILVRLQGKPVPSSECVHCGREIKHPQSLHFGIGSTCIQKFPHLLENVNYDDIETSYQALLDSMSSIVWEGWLPKGHIEMIPEKMVTDVVFEFNGKQYHVQTDNQEKLEKIKSQSNIISIKEVAL